MTMTEDITMTAAEALEAARQEGIDIKLNTDGGIDILPRRLPYGPATAIQAVKQHQEQIICLLQDGAAKSDATKGHVDDPHWKAMAGQAKRDIVVVRADDRWAVLDLKRRTFESAVLGDPPLPVILYARVKSHLVAEFIRDTLIEGIDRMGPIYVEEGTEPSDRLVTAYRIFEHLSRCNLPLSEARAIALDLGRARPWERSVKDRGFGAADGMDENIPF